MFAFCAKFHKHKICVLQINYQYRLFVVCDVHNFLYYKFHRWNSDNTPENINREVDIKFKDLFDLYWNAWNLKSRCIWRFCEYEMNIVSKGIPYNLINDGTTSFFRACVLSEISPCIVNRQQQQNVQCNHSNNMSRKKNVSYDINDNNVG